MASVGADADLLATSAVAQLELARSLRREGTALDDALAALRAAPSEVDVQVPDLGGHADHLATQWAEIGEDVGRVGAAFRAADEGFWGQLGLASVLRSVVAEARAEARPWEVDAAVVDTAVADVRAALDPGGWGVRGNDLARIQETFERLDGPEADALVAELTDEELARWFDQLQEGRLKGGWSAARRRELFVVVGTTVSLDTWRRLGRFSEEIDPSPATGGGDTARDDPARQAAFDELVYREVDGVLVAAGPGDAAAFAYDDVQQGIIGDCYLIAAMQALAMHDPAALEDVVAPNANGTYTVTFGDGQQVVVSPDLPTTPGGQLALARNGSSPDGGTELWPMLVEKAVAQRAGGWGDIVGGSQSDAIELLTGRDAGWIDDDDVTVADLAARVDAGEILGLSTIDAPDGAVIAEWREEPDTPEPFSREARQRLEQNHAFIVTDVDAAAGTVTVVNPWYPSEGSVVLTEDELRASVNGVRTSAAPDGDG